MSGPKRRVFPETFKGEAWIGWATSGFYHKWKPFLGKPLHRERNLLERFFSKLEHFHRVSKRYDKLAANFLAMIQLASMRLWLRL